MGRLGPIRNSSGDDRHKSSLKNNSKRKANDDSDSGFGKNRKNESYYSKSGKDVRSSNSRNSPIRNEKWKSQDDKYVKRNKDKELSSESSPPAKRSRDSSEPKDETKSGNGRSPSPTGKQANR